MNLEEGLRLAEEHTRIETEEEARLVEEERLKSEEEEEDLRMKAEGARIDLLMEQG